VVLRPAPVDDATRFDWVRRDYPELLYAPPSWVPYEPGVWAKLMPLPDDMAMLVNLTYHADLNVNFASTMTLDFAIRDKPVVNVAFDMSEPPSHGVPQWDYVRQFEHYRPVIELGAARTARTEAELAEHANVYLQNPRLDRDGRRRLVELEVGAPIGESCGRILNVLERIAAA
jgi:hypothetical protein